MPSTIRATFLGRRRLLVALAVAVVVLATATRVTLAATSGGGASYRTAVASRGTVTETLRRTGTIEPVEAATVAFPMSGTVADVPVHQGDAVTTGQALATLDTTALQSQLTSKQAVLADAQLTLSKALNGQATSVGGQAASGGGQAASGGSTRSSGASATPTTAQAAASTSRTGGSGARGTASGSAGGSGSGGGADSSLAASQQRVLSGQKQVDADLRTATVALQAATALCASTVPVSVSPAARTVGVSKARRPATTTTTTPPAGTGTGGGAGGGTGLGSAACLAAEKGVLADQQTVATDEKAVADAETALDALLGTKAASQATPAQPSAASGSSTGATSGGGSSSKSATPTAADLVADQAAVDAATADLGTAQQSVDQATIVSPISGMVARVGVSSGQQVEADSSTANVVVVGPGGDEVATTVSVDDIAKVHLGDAATVVPDGTGTPLDAKVVSIGVTPTVSGTTTSYPVVVGFSDAPPDLRIGAAVAVTLEVGHADGAVTVPTSAVRAVGNARIVTVMSRGKPSTVRVTVGATGADRTEITSGLRSGQVVVLADLGQPLPSSSTNSNRFGGGGGLGGLNGGLGGGGAGGGRFVGGGGGGPRG